MQVVQELPIRFQGQALYMEEEVEVAGAHRVEQMELVAMEVVVLDPTLTT